MISRYSTLFSSLVLLVVLIGIHSEGPFFAVLRAALFTLVAISGVYVASTRRFQVVVSAIFAVLWIGVLWIAEVYTTPWLIVLNAVLAILFLGFTIRLILIHITHAHDVTPDLLFGACNVYLMLGCAWALLYALIQQLVPGAFTAPEIQDNLPLSTLMYYSFTTLTTLGYGDVLPVAGIARAAAILEAIAGVLYTTILVARLMGIYLVGVQEKIQLKRQKKAGDAESIPPAAPKKLP